MAATLKPTTPVLNTGDPLLSALICALPFMDGFGTVATDISGHGRPGTLTAGATWFNDPTLGVVVQLDGTSGYVALSSLLNAAIVAGGTPVGGCTLSMWLKLRNDPPVVTTKTGLMDLGTLSAPNTASKWPAGGSFGSEVNGRGYLNVLRSSTRLDVGSVAATNKTNWHLVNITFQAGGSWKLYINGALFFTASADLSVPATLTPILGRSSESGGAGPFFLDGWLGDFRVYNRELLAPEVLSLWNSPWNLYTVTVPIGQSRTQAELVEMSVSRNFAEHLLAEVVEVRPARSYATRTAVLLVDFVPYHDTGASPLPPNDPGLFPLNQQDAFNPRLKPLNSGPPALNGDPVNSGTIFAMPFTEGSTGPGSAPSVAAGAGGAVTLGTHQWVYSYVTATFETGPSPLSTSLNITGGNQSVSVTGITVGPAGTIARKLYRTLAGGSGTYFLVTTINNNTTTSFVDSIADGSLGSLGPLSANDRSGNGNNGALVNASWDLTLSSYYATNRNKSPSLRIPTTSQGFYVRVPRTAVLEPVTNLTLSAWVRPSGFSGAIAPFISKLASGGTIRSYLLAMTNAGQFRFSLTDTVDGESVILAGGSYPNSQSTGPYFVVGTYDGSVMNLYVNGALVATSGQGGSIQYNPTPGDLYIGGDTINSSAFGNIESVQIWNRALSASEVANLWSRDHTGFNATALAVADPGSGAWGVYSNGRLCDELALMVEVTPPKSSAARLTALMLDVIGFVQSAGTVGGRSSTRVLTAMVDAIPAVQNAAGLGIGAIFPNSGSFVGGTAVTIKGLYFRNVTAVFVGGVACTSVVVVNEGTITAVTGARAAGFADVRVDSSSFGTTIAPNLYQYVGGLVTGQNALLRGKQFTATLWHQDPPGSFYTGLVAPLGSDTTLSFTLTDRPTTAQATEVYVRHVGDTGYGRMRYLIDWDVDITNKRVIWKGATAAFALIASDEMVVAYPGQN